MTDEEDITELVERTRDRFGSIDILVNNAGVVRLGPFTATDRTAIRDQVDFNLLGTQNVTHEVLPGMVESGGGDIVVVSSGNARNPAAASNSRLLSRWAPT